MAKVIIFTSAYNAEKTIKRCIESVLNQTYVNFVYYLLDNGSTDKTGEIIAEYSKKDNRIIHWHNEINYIGKNQFTVFAEPNVYDNDYYCRLDADDEYTPLFFEKMLLFINENQLDVAACGHKFLDAQTGKFQGVRLLEENLILEDKGRFSDCFPKYHQFMRTIWCKVFSLAVLRKCNFEKVATVSYGNDTIFTIEAFRSAKRVGILSESLHNYYVSQKSTSYVFNRKRIVSDQILDNITRDFLLHKCGTISHNNERFLHLVYFNAIKDTLAVLLNSQISILEKTQQLQNVFTYETAQDLFNRGFVEDAELDKHIRMPILELILFQKDFRRLHGIKAVVNIITVMYPDLPNVIKPEILEYLCIKMPEMVEYLIDKKYHQIVDRLQIWYKKHDRDNSLLSELEILSYHNLNKPDNEIFMLYVDIQKKRPISYDKLNVAQQIYNLTSKYSILQNISPELACIFSSTVNWILKADIIRAMKEFIAISQKVEIADVDVEAYILFGQNLSASANHTESYIYFHKVWISFLINSFRIEEAWQELDEFIRLLPNDEDFLTLRKKLISKLELEQ